MLKEKGPVAATTDTKQSPGELTPETLSLLILHPGVSLPDKSPPSSKIPSTHTTFTSFVPEYFNTRPKKTRALQLRRVKLESVERQDS
jgi:hypothetical protein